MILDSPLVQFRNVSFFYVNRERPENEQVGADDINFIFRELELDLPGAVLSIVGGNGVGKSTLMLLASARLFPVSGSIRLFDTDSSQWRHAGEKPEIEAERNALVSVVYQNMEFESQDSIAALIEQVFALGLHNSNSDWVIEECREVLELDGLMGRRFQQLSKGEMQTGPHCPCRRLWFITHNNG